MVSEEVKNDCDIMPLFIFPRRLKLNTEAYIKWLKEVMLSWIEKIATRRPYLW